MSEIKPGYKRVTEVLYVFSGLSSIPYEILEKAKIRGTAIHSYCDAIIDAMEVPNIEPEWQGYIDSFHKWETRKKFLTKPPRLYCDKYMICGEVDGLFKDGNDVVLFDFKTPAKESHTWQLQMSAYHYLCNVNGIKVDRIQIVKLDKMGNNPMILDYEIDFESYLDCLQVYNKYFYNKKSEDLYMDYL